MSERAYVCGEELIRSENESQIEWNNRMKQSFIDHFGPDPRETVMVNGKSFTRHSTESMDDYVARVNKACLDEFQLKHIVTSTSMDPPKPPNNRHTRRVLMAVRRKEMQS